jgi:DNA-binding transcriptional regulator YiaG
MKKRINEFIFEAFGFPVLLRDVPVGEADSGEEFLDINMKVLEEVVAKSLITSSITLTGVTLKFLRGFLGLSLRDLGSEIEVPHTSLKLWEDNQDKKTGLDENQEKRLKYLVLLKVHTNEQKEFSKCLFDSKASRQNQEGPLQILSVYKYGA